jgi:hypothetical protein
MEPQIHPSHEELDRVYDAMKGESHRGCVLVGASLIESQMGKLLESTFLSRHEAPNDEIREQVKVMLNPSSEKSILGTAAARARMCRSLNLISAETHKLLKKFLIFRNQHFGHSFEAAKLTDEKILRDLNKLCKLTPRGFTDFFAREGNRGPKGRFLLLVVILYALLDPHHQADHTESQPSTS